MGKTKTVLIVEDYENWQAFFEIELDGKVRILQALTVEQARDIFEKHLNAANESDIDCIAMDGCVPEGGVLRGGPNTMNLIGEFRRNFYGSIIAMSSMGDYRKKLLDAGCDIECSDKSKLPKMILDLLGA